MSNASLWADAFTGIPAFAGVLVGAGLQFWFTNRTNVKQERMQARRSAYEKYLEGIGKLSFAKDEASRTEALAVIAEARGRVAVCGSDRTIMLMNRLFQHGENLYSIKGTEDATALIKQMREDTAGSLLSHMDSEYFLMVFGHGPGGNKR